VVIAAAEIACGSKEIGRPLSRFPLRGKAGAGGFPPRRSTSRASKNRWHAPCAGSPHKRGCRPLVDPLREPYGRREILVQLKKHMESGNSEED
jgi:hypothetical protein